MSDHDPYRRIAGFYDTVLEPMMTGVRRRALTEVQPQPDWRVLDVGCGTGASLAGYIEAGCAVAGVEVSPAMAERARARLGERADIRITDGGPLPFGDAGFDLVTTSMVLHEVPSGQRTDLLKEMARVAGAGGRLMIVDFRFGSLRGWKGPFFRGLHGVIERVSSHYSGYKSFKAAGGVPALVGDAGLTVEREKIVAGGNIGIYLITLDSGG